MDACMGGWKDGGMEMEGKTGDEWMGEWRMSRCKMLGETATRLSWTAIADAKLFPSVFERAWLLYLFLTRTSVAK